MPTGAKRSQEVKPRQRILLTVVSVCFLEEIPTCEPAWDDIPNWFTEEDVRGLRDVFRYHFTDTEYAKIEASLAGRTFRSPDDIVLE
jgi:hypothetical protein